jgi:hypothetical protein
MDVDLGVWRQFPKLRRRGVRTIRLELETLVEKVGQLITIMDQIRERHGTVEGGWVMKPMSEEKFMAWSGPMFLGMDWSLNDGRSKLEYEVFALEWKREVG